MAAHAQVIQTMCPQSLKIEHNAINVSGDWMLNRQPTNNDNGVFSIDNIEFSYGDPEETAFMAPFSDETKTKKGISVNISRWNFRLTDGEIWVSCDYKNTDILLKRKLPADIRSCTATTYYKDPNHPVKSIFDCK